MMPSLQWIQHNGKRILYADIASQKTEELLDIVERLKPVIEKEPPNSVLCICDVTDGKTNTEMMNALKEFAKYIDPYIKIIVILGIEGLKTILFNSVVMFTRSKKFFLKKSKEEALDWLAEQ
jgi:hypothetical protein